MIFLELHFQPLYYASGEAPWSLVMNFFWGNVQIWKQELNNFPLATNYRHRRERGGRILNSMVFSKYFSFFQVEPFLKISAIDLSDRTLSRIEMCAKDCSERFLPPCLLCEISSLANMCQSVGSQKEEEIHWQWRGSHSQRWKTASPGGYKEKHLFFLVNILETTLIQDISTVWISQLNILSNKMCFLN